MNPWKSTCANNREDRHRFRSTIDTSTPVLAKQEQNRGNKRTCVTNTDPKHEVYDWPAPENWRHVTPYANPGEYQIADQPAEHTQGRQRDAKSDPPRKRLSLFADPRDHVGQRAVRVLAGYQLRTPTGGIKRIVNNSMTSCGRHGPRQILRGHEIRNDRHHDHHDGHLPIDRLFSVADACCEHEPGIASAA